ncbi:uncharacterized protein N7511_002874 [Penicillium nucicola]|uniref:uncharacterized protein n=1 Tax=Penicillium nucicola TaxID=1850975 RepID=UPI002545592E|nr:uncharacterized protein N7511_002874 [Penicillium nucicola]KAJ5770823.1 hypothetical protein N7511_002874 [Penicillium nucicola]
MSRQKRDPGYVIGLEDQIELLNSELSRLKDLNSQNENPGQHHKEPRFDSTTEQDEASSTFSNGSKKPTPIEDVSSMIWRMSIEDSGEPAFIGPSGNSCFPIAQRSPPGNNIDIETSTLKRPVVRTDPGNHEARITNHLINLFVEFINPFHSFVDKSALDQLRGEDMNPELSLVKHAALAAASILADDEESRAFGNDAASAVESVLLQACRQYPSSISHFLAMCASMTLHLGLPVSSLHALQKSTNGDDRAGIGAAWSALLIDRISPPPRKLIQENRIATSLLGRNCMLPWARVRAPSFIQTIATPSVCDLAFDSHCRLWFLHDQWMDKIYSFDFDGLNHSEQHRLLLSAREQLLSFQRDMAERVHLNSKNSSPAVIILHMTYNMSQILIHRPFLKHPAESSTFRLSMRAMSIASVSMVNLIRDYEKVAKLDKAPPYVAHSIMTAAVTALLNATSTQPTLRSQSIRHFRACFNALMSMQKRWIKARRFVLSLQDLAQRWDILQALPLHGFPASASVSTEHTMEIPQLECDTALQDDPLEDFDIDNVLAGLSWSDFSSVDFFASYQPEITDLHIPFECQL